MRGSAACISSAFVVLCFLLTPEVGAQRLSAPDGGSRSLFRSRPEEVAVRRCCPPGETRPERCLEILDRELGVDRSDSVVLERAVCAAIFLGERLAVGPPSSRSQDGGCPPTGRHERRYYDPGLVGIFTEDLERSGWYGASQRMPRGLDTVELAPTPRELLPISSSGCREHPRGARPGWREALARCTHYSEVDVFVSLQEDGDTFIDHLAGLHPWQRRSGTRDRVRVFHGRTPDEVRSQVVSLLKECKVIRRLTVGGHGAPGVVQFGGGVATTTSQFLLHVITPCALSLHSRIQFTNCLQACRDVAPHLLAGLNSIFGNSIYRPASGGRPFSDLRLLFNTDLGLEATDSFGYWVRGRRPRTWSRNDLSWEVRIDEDGVARGDVPAEQTPVCPRPSEVLGLPGIGGATEGGRWPFAAHPSLVNPYR